MESAAGTVHPPSATQARAALDAVADDRHRVATTLRTNARWYAPSYGTLVGALLLAPAAPPDAFPAVVLVGILGFVALATAYWLRVGMWPRPGSPVQVLAMVLIAALVIAGMAVSWSAWQIWDLPGLGIAIAGGAGLVAALLSWSFDHAAARALDGP